MPKAAQAEADNEPPLALLVERAKNRDADAFASLYVRYQYSVNLSINRIVQCPQTAQDILQEAFLIAWNKLPSTNHETMDKFPFWVRTIAIRLALNHLDSAKRKGIHVAMQECGEDELYRFLNYAAGPEEQVIQSECIEKASAQLTPEQRTCMRLYYIKGMRQKEIAKVLGMSEGQVEQHIGRGRKIFCAVYERVSGPRTKRKK